MSRSCLANKGFVTFMCMVSWLNVQNFHPNTVLFDFRIQASNIKRPRAHISLDSRGFQFGCILESHGESFNPSVQPAQQITKVEISGDVKPALMLFNWIKWLYWAANMRTIAVVNILITLKHICLAQIPLPSIKHMLSRVYLFICLFSFPPTMGILIFKMSSSSFDHP